jgi:CubicO group peptidase (beta-lactamase class C family)
VSLPDRVAAYAERHRLPALVLGVVDERGLVEVVEHGYADPATGVPADRSTLFRIASVTKTFTATAVLHLREEKSVGLDDPVVEHVPELDGVGGLPGAAARITIRQLLQHSSGLQGEAPSLDLLAQPLHTAEEILRVLPRARVLTAPGTAFRYSNLGYRILAELLRRRTGQRWAELAPHRLLEPLGMHDTHATPAHPDRCAVGHLPGRFQDQPRPAAPVDSALAEGDGDLWSSLDDLALWVVAQLGAAAGRDSAVLTAETMREMQQPTFVADDDWAEARGLGWNGIRRPAGPIVSHGGLFAGFNSQVCFSPTHGVGVVALTNAVAAESVGTLAFDVLDDAVAARPKPSTVPSGAAVAPEWAAYLGRYDDAEDGDGITIELRKGRLVCVHSATAPPLELAPDAEPDRFLVDLEEWRFVRDAGGQVVCLNARGYPLHKESR